MGTGFFHKGYYLLIPGITVVHLLAYSYKRDANLQQPCSQLIEMRAALKGCLFSLHYMSRTEQYCAVAAKVSYKNVCLHRL